MRVHYNERLAIRLYQGCTIVYVPLTVLVWWLCRSLPQPFSLLLLWACCCLQMAVSPLMVWQLTLRGLDWRCGHISIEAPLLVSRSYTVHHAQFPLSLAQQPRMTSGPSILLLCTCAMLTIPEKHRSAAQEAVISFLAPLKLDQGRFIRKHQLLGTRADQGLNWLICQDGQSLRAYASGDARTILSACGYIWDGERKPLTDAHRRELLALWDDEELPPVGFAMADQEGGQPVNAVFLGAMLMCRTLLPHARHQVDTLRRAGYAVSLQGLESRAHQRLSKLLGCDPLPEPDDAVLTLACTENAQGDNIYVIPADLHPTNAMGYLRTQFLRLWYHPVQASLLLTITLLCCLTAHLDAAVLVLYHVLLLAQLSFAPLEPRPLRRVRLRRVLIGTAAALAFVPACCFAAAWFISLTHAPVSSACILFLLPFTMLTGRMCARFSAVTQPALTLLPVLIYAVLMIALAIQTGLTLVSALFALVAGLLCTFVLTQILRYADRR